MKRVLALDLGTQCGWALRTREGSRITGGVTFEIKRGESAGVRLLRFRNFLTESKGPDGLDLVTYELVEFASTTYAAQLYGQFLGILFAWCEHHRIEFHGVKVSEIKRHGTGKGGGKAANKDAMKAAAARLGVTTDDDNEADAVVLLDYTERHLTEAESIS
jgi:Holliday junction resolvasome RuvABC endonuclease subunit